jgi:hypothetical protein
MFGRPVDPNSKTGPWLGKLADAEPATRLGALVSKNLREDNNVCGEYGSAVHDYLDTRNEPATPAEAVAAYRGLLDHLKSTGRTFDGPHNSSNKLLPVPFPHLGRVVTLEDFMVYNVFGRRRVLRAHYLDDLGRRIAKRQIAKVAPSPKDLQLNIGGSAVFAAAEADLSSTTDADELRNRLGLDDDARFGRGKSMVVESYEASRIPGAECYRPTVLDAGWHPAAGAFRPSTAPPPVTHGWTQHLRTGDQAVPEVIHPPFPASEIDRFEIRGPCVEDPPADYRSKRLGTMP